MPTETALSPTPRADGDAIVDTRDGLERIMGDRPLYARMLVRFREDYRAGTAAILHALDTGDRELAHRLTHTMMGAAGMIGARRLHAQAAAAERALRTGSGAEAGTLAQLAIELDLAGSHIDDLIAQMPAPTTPSRAVSRTPALHTDTTLLAQLDTLLENGDGAAVDLLESSRLSLQAVLGDAALAELTAATHDFDFERALSTLRRAA